MSEKILIIGAGAAGLMAAGTISGRGKDVAILERNDKPARKVAITGKGRCNVTNNCKELSELIANVPTNGRFLYSAFSNFMPQDTIDLIEDMGVPLKCERGNRVFPCSDKATDIVDALVHYGTDDGAQIINGRAKELIIKDGVLKGVRNFDGEEIAADKVIIATGGKSYPLTGSTGDGYELARQAGHTIIEPKPSLVPLNAHEGFCTDLMGLSLRRSLTRRRKIKSYMMISVRCFSLISEFRVRWFFRQARESVTWSLADILFRSTSSRRSPRNSSMHEFSGIFRRILIRISSIHSVRFCRES